MYTIPSETATQSPMPTHDRLLARQAMLAEFGRFALRDHAPEALLAEACQVAARGLEATRVGIWRAEPAEQRLVAGAGWPRGLVGQLRRDPAEPPAEQALAATIPLAGGAFGQIEATGGPQDAAFLELLATTLGLALARLGMTARDGFLRSVLDASTDCIKVVEGDGRLSFMNANGQCAMEIDDFSAIAGADWASLWPAESRRQVTAAVESARAGRASRFEAFCPTAKGTPKWWDVSVAPIQPGQGDAASLVSISRDITARVRAERALEQALADKDLLAREIDHRVKNSLTMVASLLSVQERGVASPEAKEALAAAVARIRTIARIHERLYQSADLETVEFAGYIQALGQDVTQSLAREDADLTIEVDPLTLPVTIALPLGLVAVELLTNALKHARREGARSRLTLTVRQTPAGLRLSVGDDGPGLPAGFDPALSKGLGMRLVRSLARQLGGRLEARNAGGGACFTLALPPRRERRQEAA